MTTRDTPPRTGPATGEDQELDRLLDTLVPPPPSDTLRARLVRNFSPAPADRGGDIRRPAAGARFGALAVAASLALAVALAVTMPAPVRDAAGPDATAQDASVTAVQEPDAMTLATATDPFAENGMDEADNQDDQDFALADIRPDSAAYVVALAGTATNGSGGTSNAIAVMPLE